jgi:hypothetical protein
MIAEASPSAMPCSNLAIADTTKVNSNAAFVSGCRQEGVTVGV